MRNPIILFAILGQVLIGCNKHEPLETDWKRHGEPVLKDFIEEANYYVSSDAQIFFDESGQLYMIYSGEDNEVPSIKYATGNSFTDWTIQGGLISNTLPSGLNAFKETAVYLLAPNGKHQIYYIGYPDEELYEANIFLAEADNITGPYTTIETPIVSKGLLGGKDVYTMTSPSVVEHEGVLYMSFIGWDNSPAEVTEVWILGCTSNNNGATWSEVAEVDSPIGMEGQVTKGPDGRFYAVATGEYNKKREGIYYAESDHPFGPWSSSTTPILTQIGKPYETDEIIAPQICFDPVTNKKHLFYTGANHKKGWWIMMASEPD